MTPVQVVSAAIMDQEGRFLVAQRGLDKPDGGCWEFPGGKIEPGEHPRLAVLREIKEELGVSVDVVQRYYSEVVDREHGRFHVGFYLCYLQPGQRPRSIQCHAHHFSRLSAIDPKTFYNPSALAALIALIRETYGDVAL